MSTNIRVSLVEADADAQNFALIGFEHFEAKTVGLDDLPGARNVACNTIQQSSDCAGGGVAHGGVEFHAEQFADFIHRDAAADYQRAASFANHIGRRPAIFFADFGAGDRFSIQWVERFRGPVYLLLNKVDRIHKQLLLPMIERYNKVFEFAEIFPISALTGAGCLDLVNSWLTRLPEAPPHFPADQFTDQPERFLAAELVREKAILTTREEVPHLSLIHI